MARISLDPPVTPTYRLASWYSRRTYGAVLDPGAAMAHNPRVLRGYLRFEQGVARWNRLDPTLAGIALSRGTLHYRQKRYPEALADFQQAFGPDLAGLERRYRAYLQGLVAQYAPSKR